MGFYTLTSSQSTLGLNLGCTCANKRLGGLSGSDGGVLKLGYGVRPLLRLLSWLHPGEDCKERGQCFRYNWWEKSSDDGCWEGSYGEGG